MESADDRSLSPLLSGFAEGDVPPSVPVTAEAGPITSNRGTLVDEVVVTGTVGGIVPENWAEFAAGEDVKLGSTELDGVALRRSDDGMSASEVVAEPFSGGSRSRSRAVS